LHYNFAMLGVLPLHISIFPSCPPDTNPLSLQSILKTLPAVGSRSSLKMLPDGLRISHTRRLPSNEPLTNVYWLSGDAARLEAKPWCPRRTKAEIVCERGSCNTIVFPVVPTASSEAAVKEAMDRRGAEKGVAETACEDGESKS
jgi:hypothetical protein